MTPSLGRLARGALLAFAAALALLVLGGCGGASPAVATSTPLPATETPVQAATVAPTPTATATAAPPPRPSPTATATTAPTLTPTPQPSPTPTPLPPPPTPTATPTERPTAFATTTGALSTVEVVRLLAPSVVHIRTDSVSMGFLNQPIPDRGAGTGVVLDREGHILTNNHVIEGAQSITVTLASGDSYAGEIVGTDPPTDLAVVRIQAPGLQPATFGTSATLQVGEDVIAVGHALGLPGGPTVSKGVVSALGRTIDLDAQTTLIDLIQTDASINPGNSGGPLANSRGEVVGINTAIIQEGQGIGFAINVDDARAVVEELVAFGHVERGFLGITPVNFTAALAAQLAAPPPVTSGVIVARVVQGSPAANAGIKQGDVIVRMAGQPIRNTGELSRFLLAHAPGETVTVVLYRGEEALPVQVALAQRPQP